MLEWHAFGVHWRVSLLFPAMLTALLLWKPDSMAIPCVLASLIHEGGHLLAMMLVGVPPQDFFLGIFGAQMHIGNGSVGYRQNILISLSGPLVNLLSAIILLLCQCHVAVAVHMLLAGVNLLPAMGLDGGEILRNCMLLLGFDRKVLFIMRMASVLTLLPIAVVGFYILFFGVGNGSLLILCAYLVILIFSAEKNEKTS